MKKYILLFLFSIVIFATSKRIELEPKDMALNGWIKVSKANPNEKINLLFALKHENRDQLLVIPFSSNQKKKIFLLWKFFIFSIQKKKKKKDLLMRVSDPKSKDYGNHLSWNQAGYLFIKKFVFFLTFLFWRSLIAPRSENISTTQFQFII